MSPRPPLEERLRLVPEALADRCDPAALPYSRTDELEPLEATPGQSRALEALDFGLSVDHPGSHLFLCGLPGSGRRATLRRLLQERARVQAPPPDRLLRHDFQAPHEPDWIEVPAGRGPEAVALMERCLGEVADRLPNLLGALQRGAEPGEGGEARAAAALLGQILEAPADAFPALSAHVREVQAQLLLHLDTFREPPRPPDLGAPPPHRPCYPLLRWCGLHLFTSGTGSGGAPVVELEGGGLGALLGGPAPPDPPGAAARFQQLLPGALQRAHGGFLVLPASEILRKPEAWEALKRALRRGECRWDEHGEATPGRPPSPLRPRPLPVRAKVILVGTPLEHHQLWTQDEGFAELFRVRAEFSHDLPRRPDGEVGYGRLLAALTALEGTRPFQASAAARLIDHGARLAEHRHRLTARLGEIAEIAREASWLAARSGELVVNAARVEAALGRRRRRVDLSEEQLQDLLDEGAIRLDLSGEQIGQLNALTVYELGDHVFSRPSRVSARVSQGKEGVVDIERECEQGGALHTKGVLVLTGFLQGRYATRTPLSVSISLGFEESHEEIDGDSAASCELYCVLSALAQVPLRQGIAATGAVDQFGQILAVGGINEKIEGFFEACRRRGLNRRQGVILPRANLMNLMLPGEIQEAVQRGRFHLWAISHADEGIELLTGIPAGRQRRDGTWPRESLNARVAERLADLAEDLRQYNREG